ncbi:ammonium transporter [Rathayibacter toxicus]|uniref:Ammonium transporter n=1 Tax=Rathayibacter toxicus TaxID=145458 RepID=A0A0C5BHE4_9MICO|nr:ammonium transporter [Rathayibacter toxicus]AJM77660.1 ammonia channel protein [Rathayibacter toxicus]ALS56399.1 ammonia channel protein [Rathayibacter toxicus]KKM44509.1 ammonia channel protein [Rathayibacter toxicus]PPG21785.1 ammonium transporter [Rathayibacter toxicus]PPG46747.1 ammonium transporter [Rathayibacter toxicus]
MDQGNTAFMLVAAALVLLMTPGLAFFYGGLVRAKSVISMMMLSFGAMGLIGVLWVLYGYAITFSNAGTGDFVGIDGVLGIDLSQLGLSGVYTEAQTGAATTAYPTMAFAAFQATFAIITVALISGAIADRAKFGSWLIFAGAWATLVYFPVASWIFNFTADPQSGKVTDGGWIVYRIGAIDFAGGTAVHINAGAAALALALVLGKRVNFTKGAHQPHNPPFVLLGAGLLWFGWFGFNAGSELAANGIAAIAFLNTVASPAAAILGWLIVEKIRDGKPTSIGAASGAVAGLVAITPACAVLSPFWAIVLGIFTGAVCALAIDLKYKLGYDDSLDVVGVHLVGGLIGTLYIGFFGTDVGLVLGHGFDQLGKQALAAATVLVHSFVLSYVIGWVIQKTIGFRVKNEDEIAGIDTAVHGEAGYVLAD